MVVSKAASTAAHSADAMVEQKDLLGENLAVLKAESMVEMKVAWLVAYLG